MPGIIRCDQIDLNNVEVINLLLKSLSDLLANQSYCFTLTVEGKFYFSTPNGPLTDDSGWYIISSGQDNQLIYVGTASNLNTRLNTRDGSRDNFANPQRTTDDVRNIIKKFVTIGVWPSLVVRIIPEKLLCQKMGLTSPLTKRDRENVEKVVNLFRSHLIA